MKQVKEPISPPKWPLRFLRSFIKKEYLEEIEGDMEEMFLENLEKYSIKRAKRVYAWESLKLFRPNLIKDIECTYNLNQYSMFKNNLKIGWRNLLKNKGLYTINITGLAIGIATCLIILLFVADELSYDRYNEKADQIVRVVLKGKMNGELIKEAVTSAPVAPTLQQEFPEILQGTRLRDYSTPRITYKNNTFRDSKVAFVDANFFNVFTLSFINGDPKTALKEPNTVVITQEEAIKYFGSEDPLGKILDLKEWPAQFKVTGVIDKVPVNSHFHFDLFVSMKGLNDAKEFKWLESNYHSYLLLDKNSDYNDLESKMPTFVEKYMGPQVKQALGISMVEFNEMGNEVGLFFQPLTDIHLYSDFASITELEQGGDIKTVYIFSAIAIFVLLVACINFMNLSTATASKRAKEVGIKRVMGSAKKQLLIQFLTESSISTILAMLLAFIIVLNVLPLFNSLSGKVLQVTHILNLQTLLYLLVFGIFISLLAGSYPAFFLSSFKPISALKNKLTVTRGKGFRSGLVVFQFVISAGLILATLVVNEQMSFILNKNIGYDKDQLLVLRDSWMLGEKEVVFKEYFLNDSRIEGITMSGHIPAGPSNNNITGVYPDQNSDVFRRTIVYNIDDRYIPTMGMQLVAGRNFSEEYGQESSNVIINQTAVEVFGLGDNAIGKILKSTTDNEGGTENLTVIGVVKDFHFKSLHRPIDPLIMLKNPNSGLIVRAKTSDMPGLLDDMKKKWEEFNIEEPFTYALLDELYYKTYLSEQKMGTILRIFALLTIFVACLGLFGLVTFTAEQRVKEIGIRKVLGSTVVQIITLLSLDFLKLVCFSFVIAFPFGYYLMYKWLQDFAYRVEIQWWVFALSGLITVFIALMTICLKSAKVAIANPIDSLRDE
ncbi:ABC transporter permease [Fulvivirgaceae bacterium BMA10]|uniref:ABC transporter permease n=1 Tax=Splendidivirga corallicola TaxID=3051826 RepID=A0ABT8KJV7_9BACT|nr:ABC transporter permease [Fulvivirgaceae bacterium BMA10]